MLQLIDHEVTTWRATPNCCLLDNFKFERGLRAKSWHSNLTNTNILTRTTFMTTKIS
jgi:hypothetical protein